MNDVMYIDPRTYRDKVEEEKIKVISNFIQNYCSRHHGIILSKSKPFTRYPETMSFFIKEGILDIIQEEEAPKIAAFDWDKINMWYKILVTGDILYCGGLSLDLTTNEVRLGKITIYPKPTSQRYKLLKLLLEKKNNLVSYQEILKEVFGKGEKIGKGDQEPIYELIKDLKRVLKIPQENKNIFKGGGGYMIVD